MSIYEISQEYQNLMNIIEEADGELDEETLLLLNKIEDDAKTKVDSLCKVYYNAKAEEEALDNEIIRLSKKKTTAVNKQNKIKQLLEYLVKLLGEEEITKTGNISKKIKTTFNSVSISKTKSVDDSMLTGLTLDEVYDKAKILIDEELLSVSLNKILVTEENKELLKSLSISGISLDKKEAKTFLEENKDVKTLIKIVEGTKISIR